MKSIIKQLLYILFTISSFHALGQSIDPPLSFDEILFIGNEKTKTDYLQQFVSCQLNETTLLTDIEKDVQQLRNLASVANASYKIESLENKKTLVFIIEERRTKLPIINFGGIKNNLWFGLGLIENNFGGRGNQLLAYYQNTDGRHTAEVFFRNPRGRTGKWGYSASIRKWSSIEPLYFDEGDVQYLYDNNSLSFSVIRNLTLQRNFELGGTIFREAYEQHEEQNLENPPGPQNFAINKFLSKLQFNENKLFYSFFYLKGYSVNVLGQNVYNFTDGSFFNSLEIEAKAFLRPKETINIASRFKFAVSTNIDSPFAPFVADSHVNIRGIGNRIDRGTAQTVFNVELRKTVYHKNYWAGQIVALSDLGTWRNPGGEILDLLDSDNFRHFVGGGIRIIYQKVFGATLRLDYSVDIYNLEERGFVIGLGQYF